MLVTRLRLWVARRRGAPDLPFVEKFSLMWVRRVALASTRLTACCESALSMESCLEKKSKKSLARRASKGHRVLIWYEAL